MALILAAVAVAAISFAVLFSPGSSTKAHVAQKFTIVVAGGRPSGGVERLLARKGDTIGLTVRSDVADEIHIHGYDLHKTVSAGGSVTFSFPATIDGNFVIELEARRVQIASLTVTL